LADLRVVDGNGAQIPWRPLPHLTGGMEPVPLLNAGRRGNAAVALLDLGSARAIHDRVVLDVPQGGFVRRGMVFGPDRRSGTFTPGAYGRIAAFPGSSPSPLEVDLQARYVRLEIDNGDDEPLRGLRARLFDVSHALLLEGGHPSPLTLYYGGFGIAPPDYDFARLPVSALDLDRLRVATLGAEAANASFRAPAD